jgi:hypothetical protein
MTIRPHDVTDLYLAPVALSLDAELDNLAGLSHHELRLLVAVRTNRGPGVQHEYDRAREDLLEAVTHDIEMHGWQASWHLRGLEIAHQQHRLVLGVPANVRSYLDV